MENEGELSSVEYTVGRERLSDERLGNLISTVGNHEAKSLLLGLMQSETIYTASGLNKLLLYAQGQNPAWRTSIGTPIAYCRNSLAPIGR